MSAGTDGNCRPAFVANSSRRPRLVGVLLGAVLCAGCGPSTGDGPGHRPQGLALSPAQELALGEQAYQEVFRKLPVAPSGPAVSRIREIGGRIARAAEIEPLQREINLRIRGYTFAWEFNLIKSDQVNAFCLPGGKVAVFSGLLSVAENDDQLATVMAHEIAHALAHHASERIAREQMTQQAVAAVSGAFGGMDAGSRERLIGLLSAGAGVRGLAYDRQQESEADHIGVFLMTFAAYDPAQAVRFWERMMQLSSGRARPPEVLSDHPSDARRVNQIRQWSAQAVAGYHAWKEGRTAH
jgi:metalloendopeptidase OMA1, mitochondrial